MSAVGLAFVLWLQMRCRKTNKSSVNAITTKISSRWNEVINIDHFAMNVRLRHVLVLLTPAKHEHLEHTAKNKGVRSDPVFLL